MKLPTRILLTTATLVAVNPARALAQTPPPAATAAGANNAAAATPPTNLEQVRVTADLWEAPLERIPASVSVYDQTALSAGNVRHFGDLVDQVPNLTWTGGTSRPRYLQIRGIGENSQFEGETPDSTVRFLVDDLDFTGLGTVGSTFDTRQVEVLRGPQAGAFGANAAGGLVRLVSNAPTPYWSGQVQAGAGEDGLREGGFAVGGPLSKAKPEQFMARLAVYQHNSDGFRRNVTVNRDTNARDEFSARLRLTVNPAPEWRFEGALFYADFANGYDEFALDNNGRLTYSDQPGVDTQRSRAASLRATYTGLAGAKLTSVTSGSATKSRYAYDDDWTAASYMSVSDFSRDRDVFSQELRLDSAATTGALGWIDRWTLGAYYADTDETSAYANTDPDNIRGLRTEYAAETMAAFGQVGHNFDARTRITLGLRAERIDLEGRGVKTRYRAVPNTFDPEVSFAPAFDDSLLGGKLTLERDLGATTVAFASVTRGYKAGGINVDARISPPLDPLVYGTETLWNYEVGVRGTWLERRLTGEFSAFYLARSETQVRDSAGFGGSYRFFTANAQDAHVSGVEASGAYAVTKTFSLHGSLATMDSELEAFSLANGSTGGGRALANTPRYGYTIGARYRPETGVFASAELVGRARQFDSNNQFEARRPYQVVNASVGYAFGPWTVTVWARNVFDKVYDKRVYFFGNEDPNYIETRYENRADPRQIGVTVGYRF